MKIKILFLLSYCLVFCFLFLTNCSNTVSEEPETGLTDEQIQSLKDELGERGSCFVETLAAASDVAGFPVAIPGYIPEGFNRQERIVLSQLGSGLPAEMKREDHVNIVDTNSFWQEDEKVMFSIQQSQGKAGIAGGEPVWVCGIQGEKKYLPADSRRMYPSEILTLAIQKDGYSFAMYATLAGPLDEETIEKILCSMGND